MILPFLIGAAFGMGATLALGAVQHVRVRRAEVRMYTPPVVLDALRALTAAVLRGEAPSGLEIAQVGEDNMLRYGNLLVRATNGFTYMRVFVVASGTPVLEDEQTLRDQSSYWAVNGGSDARMDRALLALCQAAFSPRFSSRNRDFTTLQSLVALLRPR